MLTFEFKDAPRPGVYTFDSTRAAEGAGQRDRDPLAYAFNVDAAAESNLKRAPATRSWSAPSRKDGHRAGAVLLCVGVGDDARRLYRERSPTPRESPWLYLLFLLILVAEQAMAVHLSFHLKGGEAAAGPPARGGGVCTSRARGERADHRRGSCQLRRVRADEAGSFVYAPRARSGY